MTVDAAVERLAAVRAFVRSAATAFGASEDALVDLVQAVDEAATNVIVHGYAGQPGAIDLSIEQRGSDIVVTLADACPPFDPTAVPEPDLSVPPEDRRPGGMGVHLIRIATDGFDHRSRGSWGNVLTLVRTLGAREAEEA
jgi:serine/threonine-protein kinase RsbW